MLLSVCRLHFQTTSSSLMVREISVLMLAVLEMLVLAPPPHLQNFLSLETSLPPALSAIQVTPLVLLAWSYRLLAQVRSGWLLQLSVFQEALLLSWHSLTPHLHTLPTASCLLIVVRPHLQTVLT